MSVNIGKVQTFREVAPDKAQALKILEEAAEVFGAWQGGVVYGWFDRGNPDAANRLLDECADVIQATCNLIAALGVDDFAPCMEACRKRNEERGRL